MNYDVNRKSNGKKIAAVVIAGVVLLSVMFLSGSILEENEDGYFKIKQAFGSGNMSVRQEAGIYAQNFGKIWTYKQACTVGIGREEGEGSANVDAVPVMFSDGSTADMTAKIRIKLPTTSEQQLRLKKEFPGGYDDFVRNGIVTTAMNAIKLSANLRSAQDAYTTLALFQQSINDQMTNGIYETKAGIKVVTRETGDKEERAVTEIVYEDPKTMLIPKRISNRLGDLGCEILECVIDVPDFDPKVKDMISKRKDEAMATELAKQAAIRAQQDAITAEEKGNAAIATAKAEEDVAKIRAVTISQKEYEVEKLNALKAQETAKRVQAEGMAEASVANAKRLAGLTPQEQAEWDYKKHVDGMKALSEGIAKANWPSVMTFGGGENSPNNPIEALGINALLDIAERQKTRSK